MGSRWTTGAGVVKAVNPFVPLGGRHRSFLEIHLAKTRQAQTTTGTKIPHMVTTSYLTRRAVERHWGRWSREWQDLAVYLSEGRAIGHTSVYQNLEALQSAGVIECLDRATGRLYGYRSDPHSHLTCSESGAILDLDIHLPADLIARIEALTGFEIESYTLQLTGHRR